MDTKELTITLTELEKRILLHIYNNKNTTVENIKKIFGDNTDTADALKQILISELILVDNKLLTSVRLQPVTLSKTNNNESICSISRYGILFCEADKRDDIEKTKQQKDKTKARIAYWITTIIAGLGLAISIIALFINNKD